MFSSVLLILFFAVQYSGTFPLGVSAAFSIDSRGFSFSPLPHLLILVLARGRKMITDYILHLETFSKTQA